MQEDADQFYKEPTKKEWTGFWTLIAVQAQNAFNEKAVQFLLIPLGVWLWGAAGSTLEYMLGAIFVIPYILFSPLVGWLADCFCKTRIIQVMSIVQILVMGCMLFCFYQHDMRAAIIWFAVFATQATILSPAKKGLVKDLLGSRYIGYGSGIIEISLVFVLLLAQIGVCFWYSYLLERYSMLPNGVEEAGWNAAILPTCVFIVLALLVAAASYLVPCYPAKQTRKFSYSLFYEHFVQMKYLWKDRLLRLSELGIAYFWCLAGSLFLILIQIAKDMQTANPEVDFSMQCGILMAWLGGGVVLGGGIASKLCKGKNELGLIPLGAIGITICTFILTVLDADTLASHVFLSLTGAFGAAYLVPLNAFLQDSCDPANRGNIIAAGNLFDNLMGLVAVVLMWLMHEYGASPQQQFFVLFLMSAFIMVTSLRLIPQEFIRMVGIWTLNLVYRPRIINAERIPERGGALIVANHVTFGDALFLTMICPRPVRFIVSEEFTRKDFPNLILSSEEKVLPKIQEFLEKLAGAVIRVVGGRLLVWVLEIFNALPISSKHPREAISKAIEGLEAGDLICIFPEGQLTRTGALTPMRRGMEMIARRAHAPIVPIYMDGLWGSILSYSRNRFFSKWPRQLPYHFTVAVGLPLNPDTFTSREVMRTFRRLSASCLEASDAGSRDALVRQLEIYGDKPLVHCPEGSLTGIQIAAALISRQTPEQHPELLKKWLQLLIDGTEDLVQLHRYWMNTTQVRRLNALKERQRHPLLTTVGHGEPCELVIGVLWPILTRTPVHLIDHPGVQIDSCISQIAGGAHMRRILLQAIPPRQVPFYDFSGGPDISTPNMRWRPCLVTPEGTVISMSTCHSAFKVDDGTIQLGARPRTRGLLLPCYSVEQTEDGENTITTLSGPSLRRAYTLPEKLYLDESGFLAQLS